MAFQWVFDHAASVSLNEREVVGISETRNETVRTVSRGSAVRKYSVIMPAGMQWSAEQANINAVDVADRFTVETITFNAAYMTWMNSTSIATGSTVDLICVEIPDWVISDRDIVRWSGPFKFVESII